MTSTRAGRGGAAQLVQQIFHNNPLIQQRLQQLEEFVQLSGQGPGNAQQQALELLTRQVDLQAVLLAYVDIFRAISVLFVLAIPLVLRWVGPPSPRLTSPRSPEYWSQNPLPQANFRETPDLAKPWIEGEKLKKTRHFHKPANTKR